MPRHLLIIALFVLVLASAVRSEEADGGYAGAFYQVPIGARPTALGGAYLAISDDGTAPLYNPAGIARLTRPIFSSSYRFMQLDRSMGYVAAITPIRGEAAIGVSWLYAGSGKVEERDADGYALGRDFYQNSHQFSVVFGKTFDRRISLGANISYVFSKMPKFDANSVGFDLGAMVYIDQFMSRERRGQTAIQDIRIGVAIKNISKKLRWVSDKYNMAYSTSESGYEQEDKVPTEFGLGVSARFFQRRLLVSTDVVKNTEQDPDLHAGAEYFVVPQFMLRTGYSAGRFVAGTGYVFVVGGKHQLAIDYAFSTDRADEGSEHIFSFDLLF